MVRGLKLRARRAIGIEPFADPLCSLRMPSLASQRRALQDRRDRQHQREAMLARRCQRLRRPFLQRGGLAAELIQDGVDAERARLREGVADLPEQRPSPALGVERLVGMAQQPERPGMISLGHGADVEPVAEGEALMALDIVEAQNLLEVPAGR